MADRSPRKSCGLSSRAKRGICFFLALSLTGALFVGAQTQPARPKILGIASVRFYSTNVAEARDFYSKTLNPDGPCLWCEEAPRPPLTVLLNKDQMISIDGSPQPTPSNLVAEVSLAVDDLEELMKYLKAQKIKVTPTKTPTLHIDAVIKVYSALSVTDPEGHRITFVRRPSQALLAPTPAVAPSNSLHLIHVGFVVRDRAVMDRFYKDILGFHLYWQGGRKDDETDWVNMQVPDGTDWIEYMLNVPADASHRTLGVVNHIALGVPDIHAAEAQLRKNGWTGSEEPKIGRGGKWQLNVYDPDDTRIEFMEFTPTQKPCCSEYTGPHPKP